MAAAAAARDLSANLNDQLSAGADGTTSTSLLGLNNDVGADAPWPLAFSVALASSSATLTLQYEQPAKARTPTRHDENESLLLWIDPLRERLLLSLPSLFSPCTTWVLCQNWAAALSQAQPKVGPHQRVFRMGSYLHQHRTCATLSLTKTHDPSLFPWSTVPLWLTTNAEEETASTSGSLSLPFEQFCDTSSLSSVNCPSRVVQPPYFSSDNREPSSQHNAIVTCLHGAKANNSAFMRVNFSNAPSASLFAKDAVQMSLMVQKRTHEHCETVLTHNFRHMLGQQALRVFLPLFRGINDVPLDHRTTFMFGRTCMSIKQHHAHQSLNATSVSTSNDSDTALSSLLLACLSTLSMSSSGSFSPPSELLSTFEQIMLLQQPFAMSFTPSDIIYYDKIAEMMCKASNQGQPNLLPSLIRYWLGRSSLTHCFRAVECLLQPVHARSCLSSELIMFLHAWSRISSAMSQRLLYRYKSIHITDLSTSSRRGSFVSALSSARTLPFSVFNRSGSDKQNNKHRVSVRKWEWEEEGSWGRFDDRVSSILEAAYQAGKSSVDYTIEGQPHVYRADFTRMVQRNLHTTREKPLRSLLSLIIREKCGRVTQTVEINMPHSTVIRELRRELATYLKHDEKLLRFMSGNRVLRRIDFNNISIKDAIVPLGAEPLTITKMAPGDVEELCTFSLTSTVAMKQEAWQCLTCDFVAPLVFCAICAQVCHRGHALSVVSSHIPVFCHCGAGAGGHDAPCKALEETILPTEPEHRPHLALSKDGGFLFTLTSDSGLVKSGTGCMNTVLGHVYLQNTLMSLHAGGSLCVLDDELYLLSPLTGPEQLLHIDAEHLMLTHRRLILCPQTLATPITSFFSSSDDELLPVSNISLTAQTTSTLRASRSLLSTNALISENMSDRLRRACSDSVFDEQQRIVPQHTQNVPITNDRMFSTWTLQYQFRSSALHDLVAEGAYSAKDLDISPMPEWRPVPVELVRRVKQAILMNPQYGQVISLPLHGSMDSAYVGSAHTGGNFTSNSEATNQFNDKINDDEIIYSLAAEMSISIEEEGLFAHVPSKLGVIRCPVRVHHREHLLPCYQVLQQARLVAFSLDAPHTPVIVEESCLKSCDTNSSTRATFPSSSYPLPSTVLRSINGLSYSTSLDQVANIKKTRHREHEITLRTYDLPHGIDSGMIQSKPPFQLTITFCRVCGRFLPEDLYSFPTDHDRNEGLQMNENSSNDAQNCRRIADSCNVCQKVNPPSSRCSLSTGFTVELAEEAKKQLDELKAASVHPHADVNHLDSYRQSKMPALLHTFPSALSPDTIPTVDKKFDRFEQSVPLSSDSAATDSFSRQQITSNSQHAAFLQAWEAELLTSAQQNPSLSTSPQSLSSKVSITFELCHLLTCARLGVLVDTYKTIPDSDSVQQHPLIACEGCGIIFSEHVAMSRCVHRECMKVVLCQCCELTNNYVSTSHSTQHCLESLVWSKSKPVTTSSAGHKVSVAGKNDKADNPFDFRTHVSQKPHLVLNEFTFCLDIRRNQLCFWQPVHCLSPTISNADVQHDVHLCDANCISCDVVQQMSVLDVTKALHSFANKSFSSDVSSSFTNCCLRKSKGDAFVFDSARDTLWTIHAASGQFERWTNSFMLSSEPLWDPSDSLVDNPSLTTATDAAALLLSQLRCVSRQPSVIYHSLSCSFRMMKTVHSSSSSSCTASHSFLLMHFLRLIHSCINLLRSDCWSYLEDMTFKQTTIDPLLDSIRIWIESHYLYFSQHKLLDVDSIPLICPTLSLRSLEFQKLDICSRLVANILCDGHKLFYPTWKARTRHLRHLIAPATTRQPLCRFVLSCLANQWRDQYMGLDPLSCFYCPELWMDDTFLGSSSVHRQMKRFGDGVFSMDRGLVAGLNKLQSNSHAPYGNALNCWDSTSLLTYPLEHQHFATYLLVQYASQLLWCAQQSQPHAISFSNIPASPLSPTAAHCSTGICKGIYRCCSIDPAVVNQHLTVFATLLVTQANLLLQTLNIRAHTLSVFMHSMNNTGSGQANSSVLEAEQAETCLIVFSRLSTALTLTWINAALPSLPTDDLPPGLSNPLLSNLLTLLCTLSELNSRATKITRQVSSKEGMDDSLVFRISCFSHLPFRLENVNSLISQLIYSQDMLDYKQLQISSAYSSRSTDFKIFDIPLSPFAEIPVVNKCFVPVSRLNPFTVRVFAAIFAEFARPCVWVQSGHLALSKCDFASFIKLKNGVTAEEALKHTQAVFKKYAEPCHTQICSMKVCSAPASHFPFTPGQHHGFIADEDRCYLLLNGFLDWMSDCVVEDPQRVLKDLRSLQYRHAFGSTYHASIGLLEDVKATFLQLVHRLLHSYQQQAVDPVGSYPLAACTTTTSSDKHNTSSSSSISTPFSKLAHSNHVANALLSRSIEDQINVKPGESSIHLASLVRKSQNSPEEKNQQHINMSLANKIMDSEDRWCKEEAREEKLAFLISFVHASPILIPSHFPSASSARLTDFHEDADGGDGQRTFPRSQEQEHSFFDDTHAAVRLSELFQRCMHELGLGSAVSRDHLGYSAFLTLPLSIQVRQSSTLRTTFHLEKAFAAALIKHNNLASTCLHFARSLDLWRLLINAANKGTRCLSQATCPRWFRLVVEGCMAHVRSPLCKMVRDIQEREDEMILSVTLEPIHDQESQLGCASKDDLRLPGQASSRSAWSTLLSYDNSSPPVLNNEVEIPVVSTAATTSERSLTRIYLSSGGEDVANLDEMSASTFVPTENDHHGPSHSISQRLSNTQIHGDLMKHNASDEPNNEPVVRSSHCSVTNNRVLHVNTKGQKKSSEPLSSPILSGSLGGLALQGDSLALQNFSAPAMESIKKSIWRMYDNAMFLLLQSLQPSENSGTRSVSANRSLDRQKNHTEIRDIEGMDNMDVLDYKWSSDGKEVPLSITRSHSDRFSSSLPRPIQADRILTPSYFTDYPSSISPSLTTSRNIANNCPLQLITVDDGVLAVPNIDDSRIDSGLLVQSNTMRRHRPQFAATTSFLPNLEKEFESTMPDSSIYTRRPKETALSAWIESSLDTGTLWRTKGLSPVQSTQASLDFINIDVDWLAELVKQPILLTESTLKWSVASLQLSLFSCVHLLSEINSCFRSGGHRELLCDVLDLIHADQLIPSILQTNSIRLRSEAVENELLFFYKHLGQVLNRQRFEPQCRSIWTDIRSILALFAVKFHHEQDSSLILGSGMLSVLARFIQKCDKALLLPELHQSFETKPVSADGSGFVNNPGSNSTHNFDVDERVMMHRFRSWAWEILLSLSALLLSGTKSKQQGYVFASTMGQQLNDMIKEALTRLTKITRMHDTPFVNISPSNANVQPVVPSESVHFVRLCFPMQRLDIQYELGQEVSELICRLVDMLKLLSSIAMEHSVCSLDHVLLYLRALRATEVNTSAFCLLPTPVQTWLIRLLRAELPHHAPSFPRLASSPVRSPSASTATTLPVDGHKQIDLAEEVLITLHSLLLEAQLSNALQKEASTSSSTKSGHGSSIPLQTHQKGAECEMAAHGENNTVVIAGKEDDALLDDCETSAVLATATPHSASSSTGSMSMSSCMSGLLPANDLDRPRMPPGTGQSHMHGVGRSSSIFSNDAPLLSVLTQTGASAVAAPANPASLSSSISASSSVSTSTSTSVRDTSHPLSPKDSSKKAHFRRIAVLRCLHCYCIEFPACPEHRCYLTKTLLVGSYNSQEHLTAACAEAHCHSTLNSKRFCSYCTQECPELLFWCISDLEAVYCADAIRSNATVVIDHNVFLCSHCHVCEFPGTKAGGLTLNVEGHLYDLPTRRFLEPSHYRFTHLTNAVHSNNSISASSLTCSGQVQLLPVKLSKSEAFFLGQLLKRTPVLDMKAIRREPTGDVYSPRLTTLSTMNENTSFGKPLPSHSDLSNSAMNGSQSSSIPAAWAYVSWEPRSEEKIKVLDQFMDMCRLFLTMPDATKASSSSQIHHNRVSSFVDPMGRLNPMALNPDDALYSSSLVSHPCAATAFPASARNSPKQSCMSSGGAGGYASSTNSPRNQFPPNSISSHEGMPRKQQWRDRLLVHLRGSLLMTPQVMQCLRSPAQIACVSEIECVRPVMTSFVASLAACHVLGGYETALRVGQRVSFVVGCVPMIGVITRLDSTVSTVSVLLSSTCSDPTIVHVPASRTIELPIDEVMCLGEGTVPSIASLNMVDDFIHLAQRCLDVCLTGHSLTKYLILRWQRSFLHLLKYQMNSFLINFPNYLRSDFDAAPFTRLIPYLAAQAQFKSSFSAMNEVSSLRQVRDYECELYRKVSDLYDPMMADRILALKKLRRPRVSVEKMPSSAAKREQLQSFAVGAYPAQSSSVLSGSRLDAALGPPPQPLLLIHLERLMQMGFSSLAARFALAHARGDIQAATNAILSDLTFEDGEIDESLVNERWNALIDRLNCREQVVAYTNYQQMTADCSTTLTASSATQVAVVSENLASDVIRSPRLMPYPHSIVDSPLSNANTQSTSASSAAIGYRLPKNGDNNREKLNAQATSHAFLGHRFMWPAEEPEAPEAQIGSSMTVNSIPPALSPIPNAYHFDDSYNKLELLHMVLTESLVGQALQITEEACAVFDHPQAERRRGYKVGDRLYIVDLVQKVCPAEVVDVNQSCTKVFIHYSGWSKKWDEWVEIDSKRIQPSYKVGDKVVVLDSANKETECEVKDLAVKDNALKIQVHYEGWSARWDEWLSVHSKRIIQRGSSLSGNKKSIYDEWQRPVRPRQHLHGALGHVVKVDASESSLCEYIGQTHKINESVHTGGLALTDDDSPWVLLRVVDEYMDESLYIWMRLSLLKLPRPRAHQQPHHFPLLNPPLNTRFHHDSSHFFHRRYSSLLVLLSSAGQVLQNHVQAQARSLLNDFMRHAILKSSFSNDSCVSFATEQYPSSHVPTDVANFDSWGLSYSDLVAVIASNSLLANSTILDQHRRCESNHPLHHFTPFYHRAQHDIQVLWNRTTTSMDDTYRRQVSCLASTTMSNILQDEFGHNLNDLISSLGSLCLSLINCVKTWSLVQLTAMASAHSAHFPHTDVRHQLVSVIPPNEDDKNERPSATWKVNFWSDPNCYTCVHELYINEPHSRLHAPFVVPNPVFITARIVRDLHRAKMNKIGKAPMHELCPVVFSITPLSTPSLEMLFTLTEIMIVARRSEGSLIRDRINASAESAFDVTRVRKLDSWLISLYQVWTNFVEQLQRTIPMPSHPRARAYELLTRLLLTLTWSHLQTSIHSPVHTNVDEKSCTMRESASINAVDIKNINSKHPLKHQTSRLHDAIEEQKEQSSGANKLLERRRSITFQEPRSFLRPAVGHTGVSTVSSQSPLLLSYTIEQQVQTPGIVDISWLSRGLVFEAKQRYAYEKTICPLHSVYLQRLVELVLAGLRYERLVVNSRHRNARSQLSSSHQRTSSLLSEASGSSATSSPASSAVETLRNKVINALPAILAIERFLGIASDMRAHPPLIQGSNISLSGDGTGSYTCGCSWCLEMEDAREQFQLSIPLLDLSSSSSLHMLIQDQDCLPDWLFTSTSSPPFEVSPCEHNRLSVVDNKVSSSPPLFLAAASALAGSLSSSFSSIFSSVQQASSPSFNAGMTPLLSAEGCVHSPSSAPLTMPSQLVPQRARSEDGEEKFVGSSSAENEYAFDRPSFLSTATNSVSLFSPTALAQRSRDRISYFSLSGMQKHFISNDQSWRAYTTLIDRVLPSLALRVKVFNLLLNATAAPNHSRPELAFRRGATHDGDDVLSAVFEDALSLERHSMFAQLVDSFVKSNLHVQSAALRAEVNTVTWKTILAGVLDQGAAGLPGPFRQVLHEICQSLTEDAYSTDEQRASCAICIPIPNSRSQTGDDRNKLMLNPGLCTEQSLVQCRVLGLLMGVAIRAKCNLDLDLSEITWKLLLDQPLKESDLSSFDYTAYKSLSFCDPVTEKPFTADEFEEYLSGLTWTTLASDQRTLLDLLPPEHKPRMTLVSYQDRWLYRRLSITQRLYESSLPLQHVRYGLCSIIPAQALDLLTAQELELRVCGRPVIDLDVLKRHTVYSPSNYDSNAPPVVMFWHVLASFTQAELAQFLQFAWARSRLPSEIGSYRMQLNILEAAHPDALPTSETCFCQYLCFVAIYILSSASHFLFLHSFHMDCFPATCFLTASAVAISS